MWKCSSSVFTAFEQYDCSHEVKMKLIIIAESNLVHGLLVLGEVTLHLFILKEQLRKLWVMINVAPHPTFSQISNVLERVAAFAGAAIFCRFYVKLAHHQSSISNEARSQWISDRPLTVVWHSPPWPCRDLPTSSM